MVSILRVAPFSAAGMGCLYWLVALLLALRQKTADVVVELP